MTAGLTRFRFRLPDPPPGPDPWAPAQEIAAELGLPPPAARLLQARGVRGAAEARAFLDPPAPPDPFRLAGVGEAVGRLGRAAAADDGVLVYGDYDCDGVCSALLAAEALRACGIRCAVHLPGRADGYGMRADTLPALAAASRCRVVLAVDNGATAHEPIAAAQAAGLDVVVADHHQCDATLPPAAAFINPVLEPGGPFAGLAGVGVVWVLAQALAAALGRAVPPSWDLVALGTIADVAPLRGPNRYLVRRGLAAMGAPGGRPGVRALLAAAGVAEGVVPTARDVSHGMAPRCNAPGRLDRPDAAYELLAAQTRAEALAALVPVEECNRARQALAEQVLAEAEAEVAAAGGAGARAVVAARPGWHPGVVGVAAARLAERLGIPVLLGAIDDRGVCRGSGRGPEGFDLTAALRRCQDLLLRFGGHAQAAGFELEAARLDALRSALAALAPDLGPEGRPREERLLDGELGAADLRLGLAAALSQLEPFGAGNPEPLFLLRASLLRDVRGLGREERHARFHIALGEHGAGRADAVAFGLGAWVDGLGAGCPFDLVVRPEVDRYRGREALQIVVVDAAPCGGDWRPFLAAMRRGLPRRHPEREELAAAFRALRRMAGDGQELPPEPALLAALAPHCGGGEEGARSAVRIFQEVGLVDSARRLRLPPGGGKVDLSASPRFQAAEAARRAVALLEAEGPAAPDADRRKGDGAAGLVRGAPRAVTG